MDDNNEPRTSQCIDDRCHPIVRPQQRVEYRQKCTVADGVVRPGLPDFQAMTNDIFRVAKSFGNTGCPKMIIVAVPHGFFGPYQSHVQTGQDCDESNDEGKYPIRANVERAFYWSSL